jgi:hypothetical protein
MTTLAQVQAFNQGVRTALSHAAAAADAIESMPGFKVTRAGFAVAALREFVEAGEELLLLPERDKAYG